MQASELVRKFEQIIIGALMAMMGLVVVLATIELGWVLVKDIVTPPVLILEVEELLDIFGVFLLVLIGLELLDTMQQYYTDRTMRVEVVIIVAIIAVARKVVIIDYSDLTTFTLLDVGLVILAFALAHYVLKRSHSRQHGAWKEPPVT